MRRCAGLVIIVVALVLSAAAAPTGPVVFSDNFNSGNLSRWWFDSGNWRVENRVLVQDDGGDSRKALVEGVVLSSQVVETDFYTGNPDWDNGAAGITVWYQDANNWIELGSYPYGPGFYVVELIDGLPANFPIGPGIGTSTWYHLKVEADSVNGTLTVWVDGVYRFTHDVVTPNRSGWSGLHTSNAGGGFDNFKITRLGGGKKK